jgi:hypothetical protein
MVPEMVLEVVLVFGHKNTLGAEEQLLWLDVSWGQKVINVTFHNYKLFLLPSFSEKKIAPSY